MGFVLHGSKRNKVLRPNQPQTRGAGRPPSHGPSARQGPGCTRHVMHAQLDGMEHTATIAMEDQAP